MKQHYAIPEIRDFIIRKRLFHKLDRSGRKGVVVVLGQAAQGKSALIASYLSPWAKNTAWLHLGGKESDHTTLFYLLVNALDQEGRFFSRAPGHPVSTLGTGEDLVRQVEILASLPDSLDREYNLVLDDLDSLDEDASSFLLIREFIKVLPPYIRLFLISRRMPPIAVDTLKMESRTLVIPNEELAFTQDETRLFMERSMKRALDAGMAEKIHSVTEGWVGGLVLLAEALVRNPDLQDLPSHLSCRTMDFFSREVLTRVPDSVRDFLMKASLFDEIDPLVAGDICGAPAAMEILRNMERRNLFIQRLAPQGRGVCFRLNKLFRTFLRQLLVEQADGETIHKLNMAAGNIALDRGELEEGIGYFLEARAFDEAGKIIKRLGTHMIIQGRHRDLAGWIEALPDDMVWQDPWLIYYLTMTRRIRGGRQNLDDFNTALTLFKRIGDIRGEMVATAHLIEASVFLRQPPGVVAQLIREGDALLASQQDNSYYAWAKAMLWQQMGFGCIAGDGDISKGISACRNSQLLARKIGDLDMVLNASIIMVFGYVQAGNFSRAEYLLEEIRELTHQAVHPEYRALRSLVDIDLALKKGEFERAEECLGLSEKDIETFGLIFLYPGFIEAKAMHRIYTGSHTDARSMADHMADFSVLSGNRFYLGLAHRIRAVSFYHTRDYSASADEAEAAVGIFESIKGRDIHLYLARQTLGLALMHLNKYRKARREITAALDYFSRISSIFSLAEANAAMGLLMWDQGLEEDAVTYVEKSTASLFQEGYNHFIVMAPFDFSRLILLGGCFDSSSSPGDFVSKLGVSAQTGNAVAELDRLMAHPFIRKKRLERIKDLYRYAMPGLRIETLGEFRVLLGGEPLSHDRFKGKRPQLLLKAMVCRDSSEVHREILIEDIWPDATAKAGEKSFKVNLHRLRKALEPNVKKEVGYLYVRLESGRVFLDPVLVSCDAVEFEHFCIKGDKNFAKQEVSKAMTWYEKAVALYKGEFLAEEPFAEWALSKRERLKRLYLDALMKLAGLYEETSQTAKAINCLNRVIIMDPLEEEACKSLMIVYADSGMTQAALSIYERLVRRLDHELGVEPDRETREIYRKIISIMN